MEFVLTKNNFTFNGIHYIQIAGTSMCTKMAPSYTNAFMGQFQDDSVYIPPNHW